MSNRTLFIALDRILKSVYNERLSYEDKRNKLIQTFLEYGTGLTSRPAENVVDFYIRTKQKGMYFIDDNGDTLMVVTPVKSLFHSSMVHSVVTSGGRFVVNLRTGELTIFRSHREPEYIFESENVTKKLSNDFEVAAVQLWDHGDGYVIFKEKGYKWPFVKSEFNDSKELARYLRSFNNLIK